MERLGEADESEGPEGSGEVLGSHLDPAGVGDLFFRGGASCLGQHSGIRIEPDDALEEVGEEEGDGTRTATDVEKAPASTQVKVLGQSVGQRRGIRLATLSVVGGRALEHGFVPGPVLPPMARVFFRHGLSVADRGPPPCRRWSGTFRPAGAPKTQK